MLRKPTSKRTRPKPKAVLRLPDLDQAKSAVLNSLTSADAQRGYRHAIDEFVEWHCSEPRLSFSKAVVLRYRMHLASRYLAPGTINLRLGAVRRLGYEAAEATQFGSRRRHTMRQGRKEARGQTRQLAYVPTSPATPALRLRRPSEGQARPRTAGGAPRLWAPPT